MGSKKRDSDDFEQMSPTPVRSGPSLKMRAVGFLSRREHSRVELARKLAAYADPNNPSELDEVLDTLERENWLSSERFAQSLVHRRAPRKGAALIIQELRQHNLPDEQLAQLRQQLQHTELERARVVWQRKFGRPPPTGPITPGNFVFLLRGVFRPIACAASWAASTMSPPKGRSVASLTYRLDAVQGLEADFPRFTHERLQVGGVDVLDAHGGVKRSPDPILAQTANAQPALVQVLGQCPVG